MTYNCEEIVDDDVETIEYRPRSYIEDDPDDFKYDSHLSVNKLERKSKSQERISTPKRGSFTDIRNAILTRVNTPRGQRRSKTLVQRCQSAGESLKVALGRTSSLDVLGGNQQKQSVDELMNGFSKLADRTLIDSEKELNLEKQSVVADDKSNVNKRCKDRSNSCPAYPISSEKGLQTVQEIVEL